MKKLVALILTFLLVLTGCNAVEVTKVEDDNKTDSIKFHDEYKTVPKENLYEYTTYDNVIDIIKGKTGIIYLGFPDCVLCKEVTPLLNEVAKENKIKSISYYNFKDIRDNNTLEYQKLLDILNEYIKSEKDKELKITGPTIIFVKDGDIKGVYIGVINGKSEEIMTDEEKNKLKQNFSSLIDKMNNPETTAEKQN